MRKAYDRLLAMLPGRMRGSIDYYLGHHSLFYPGGGPMNGQTARLEVVRTLIGALRPALLVESGTFRGTTTEWLAQFGTQVVSIETDPRFHEFSQHRLGARENVRLMLGKPVDALRQLLAECAFAQGTVLFCLDGRSAAHLPLRQQLEFIFANCPSFVIVVDNVRVEADTGYFFEDFGPDQVVNAAYLDACALPGLAVFFPAVPGREEAGLRRGSVLLTGSRYEMAVMEAMPALRAWRLPRDARQADRPPVTPSGHAPGTSRPQLDDVTLCCIDCAQPALAIRALQMSRAQCDFAASVLFTDIEIAQEGIEVRRIPPITDATSYSHFVLKQLAAHVATPFVLLIQWDGYVLDGTRWEDGFRQFDYIGAPWTLSRLHIDAPWGYARVNGLAGNGGFSLRSRRLLETLESAPIQPGRRAEDELICNVWRSALEQRGIRFADVATARRFSVESDRSKAPSFGFHGMFNFWRAIPADALEEVLRGVSPDAAGSGPACRLILEYVRLGRWAEANVALANYERQCGTAKTIEALSAVTQPGVGVVLRDAIRGNGMRSEISSPSLMSAV